VLRVTVGFPAAMATGVLSVAAAELDQTWVSWSFFGAGVCVYLLAARSFARPLDVEALAAVAATAVLATRLGLAGLRVAAGVLLVGAALGWAAAWVVLLRARRLGPPTGSLLLTVVSTEAVAILGAVASRRLEPFALALFLIGLALYPVALARIPPGELRTGAGDMWIAMGALAVSTLAAAHVATVGGGAAARALASVLWIAATCWLPVLVFAELRWRRLRFEPKRWSTVFPLGMYSACSTAVAGEGSLAPGLVGRAFFWLAVAAWLAAAVGALHRPSA